MFFLFLHENICCGYSLEVPQWGTSNEYPQHMFLWRNKKNINTFGLKKGPKLVLVKSWEIRIKFGIPYLSQIFTSLTFTLYCWVTGKHCKPRSDVPLFKVQTEFLSYLFRCPQTKEMSHSRLHFLEWWWRNLCQIHHYWNLPLWILCQKQTAHTVLLLNPSLNLCQDLGPKDLGKTPASIVLDKKSIRINIWASARQNQQNGMCTQWRLRSAWVSAPSDLSLCCPHVESLGP